MQETQVQSLGREDLLEKEMATHSSILAWKIPWMEKPGRLQSMEFSRQRYWSGLPFPPPGDLPDPGIEPGSPALQADALPSIYTHLYGIINLPPNHRLHWPNPQNFGGSLEKEKNCLCSNSQKDLMNPSKEVTVLTRILWNRGLPITP